MMGPVEYRWSGQVMETIDGLAFIGRNPMDKDNVYIATGDSGMGMTHGTIAGILLTDLILGRENPWATLYDPSRKPVWGMAWKEFLVENANVAKRIRQGLARRRRRRLRRRDPARGGRGDSPRPEEGRRLPRRPRRRARAARRSARTWAASCTGTAPRRPGTAPATAPASIPRGRSSPARPIRRWPRPEPSERRRPRCRPLSVRNCRCRPAPTSPALPQRCPRPGHSRINSASSQPSGVVNCCAPPFGNLADGHGLTRPCGRSRMCWRVCLAGELGPVDGEGGFVSQIDHDVIFHPCDARPGSAPVPSVLPPRRRIVLVRNQVPPLRTCAAPRLSGGFPSGRCRGVQGLFPCGQHPPTVIMPVAVMSTGQVGVGLSPNPQRTDHRTHTRSRVHTRLRPSAPA